MPRWSQEFCFRFRCGERAALENVYWTHVAVVEHVLKCGFWLRSRQAAVPGVADPDQRADLLQEVFLKAFSDSARQRFDPELDYRAYILSISRHLVVDHYRRVNRQVPFEDEHEESCASASSTDGDKGELLHVVEQYVATLGPPLRELHHARYVLGHSQRAAADHLGLSRQNVRTLEERVKDGLRSALQEASIVRRAVRNALDGAGIGPSGGAAKTA